ncbi:DNA polymerase III subunit beta [Desulfococcaceae bacterium HSG7]|nr:DNA polymerase III subunit beta [Desulfococcaceae bacterium HSG9]MDM8555933.1 DNA polymerase III subunit beta [Desulfococcaceae bacterium HSG7]
MKFTILKSDVINVLSNIQGITGRKTNLAITTSVLIKTADSGINIIATDLETGFDGVYPANVESDGVIAINAKKIYEIIRDFPSEEILFDEVENNWIKIGNDKIEYHIMGMSPDDFPDSPQIGDIEFFEIDSVLFKKMIDRATLISGAGDDKRAHIIGAYFERIEDDDQKLVRIASTDGNRLSAVTYDFDEDFELPSGDGVLIPKKGLTDVGKFLSAESVVQIGFKDNHFIVKKESETIIIRLLEGDFPDYKDIIRPKDDAYQIETDRRDFMMVLKRMSIIASETYKGVIYRFEKDKLTVSSTNPDLGDSKEDMNIGYDGEAKEAAFNPRYFIETLNSIDDDNVILDFVDGERPCLIQGETDKTYITALMPMRI